MAAVIRKETGASPIFAVPRYSNAAESDMLVTIAVENSGKTISNNDRKLGQSFTPVLDLDFGRSGVIGLRLVRESIQSFG